MTSALQNTTPMDANLSASDSKEIFKQTIMQYISKNEDTILNDSKYEIETIFPTNISNVSYQQVFSNGDYIEAMEELCVEMKLMIQVEANPEYLVLKITKPGKV